MDEKLAKYLKAGEGISLEFKRCGGSQVENDTFETICSFANRQGGSILLGVLDDGSVAGISAESAVSIERNIINITSLKSLMLVTEKSLSECGFPWAHRSIPLKAPCMTGQPMLT